MIKLTLREKIYLILPAVAGYAIAAVCHIGEATESDLRSRPPQAVFAFVWPVLYFFIGYSWIVMHREAKWVDILFWLNIGGIVLWPLIYGCKGDHIFGIYVMMAWLAVALITWGVAIRGRQLFPIVGIALYVVWLVYDLLLNVAEVNRGNVGRGNFKTIQKEISQD